MENEVMNPEVIEAAVEVVPSNGFSNVVKKAGITAAIIVGGYLTYKGVMWVRKKIQEKKAKNETEEVYEYVEE